MRDELVLNKIKNAIQLLDEIDEMIKSQSEEMQKVDWEISDWLHYIENNEINDKISVKIVEKLKELRIVRRGLSREHEIEGVYKNNASKMMGNNTRPLLLAEINKMVKQLDNEYKNRVITEEDIKMLIEVKKKVGRPKKLLEIEEI